MTDLLTEAEAATIAKVHPRTIRRLIEKGKLPAANYGLGRIRKYRINPADLFTVQPVQPIIRERRIRREKRADTAGKAWPP